MKLNLRNLLVVGSILVYTTLDPAEQKLKYVDKKEFNCLVNNVYHEARGEGYEGMLAVALVTLNRVRHPFKFRPTICEVVFERGQFSWTVKKKLLSYPEGLAAEASLEALTKYEKYKDFQALYYHNRKVLPPWNKQFLRTSTIRNHIFYEEQI